MSGRKQIEIEKLQGHYCFACGTANPIGLNMEFYCLGDAVCSDITLGKYHEGWENIAHGGIISALLDEAMSWSIIYFKKTFVVTRKMRIKYIKPVLIGTPLTVRGRLIDTSEKPKIEAKGEILNDKGSLLVTSTGEFVQLSKEKLSLIPEGLRKEMLLLFERFK